MSEMNIICHGLILQPAGSPAMAPNRVTSAVGTAIPVAAPTVAPVSDIVALVSKACEIAADERPRCGTQHELEACLVRYLENLPRDAIPFDTFSDLVIRIDEMNSLAPAGVTFAQWPRDDLLPKLPCHCQDRRKTLVLAMPIILFRRSSATVVARAYNALLEASLALIVEAFEPALRGALLERAFAVDNGGVIEVRLTGLPLTIGGREICYWHYLVFRAWLEEQGLPRPPVASDVAKPEVSQLSSGVAPLRFILPNDQRPHNFHVFTPNITPTVVAASASVSAGVKAPEIKPSLRSKWWANFCERSGDTLWPCCTFRTAYPYAHV